MISPVMTPADCHQWDCLSGRPFSRGRVLLSLLSVPPNRESSTDDGVLKPAVVIPSSEDPEPESLGIASCNMTSTRLHTVLHSARVVHSHTSSTTLGHRSARAHTLESVIVVHRRFGWEMLSVTSVMRRHMPATYMHYHGTAVLKDHCTVAIMQYQCTGIAIGIDQFRFLPMHGRKKRLLFVVVS